jgi:hypothetical protein
MATACASTRACAILLSATTLDASAVRWSRVACCSTVVSCASASCSERSMLRPSREAARACCSTRSTFTSFICMTHECHNLDYVATYSHGCGTTGWREAVYACNKYLRVAVRHGIAIPCISVPLLQWWELSHNPVEYLMSPLAMSACAVPPHNRRHQLCAREPEIPPTVFARYALLLALAERGTAGSVQLWTCIKIPLLCGVFVRLHLALFPAGGPFLPSLSVQI